MRTKQKYESRDLRETLFVSHHAGKLMFGFNYDQKRTLTGSKGDVYLAAFQPVDLRARVQYRRGRQHDGNGPQSGRLVL